MSRGLRRVREVKGWSVQIPDRPATSHGWQLSKLGFCLPTEAATHRPDLPGD